MKIVNESADRSQNTLRISFDAKAAVNIGEFSRLGKSRCKVKALDHDFNISTKVTPFGILLPKQDEMYLYLCKSKVTADCMMDCMEDFWINNQINFPDVEKLVINLDNGPENHSRRTQFMKRIVEFSHKHKIDIRLAYYPPYHSKYNPMERGWGVLEQHWNGSLLDSLEVVVGFAQTMTWKGTSPIVKVIEKVYKTGVRLTKLLMAEVETQITRFDKLGLTIR